MTGRTCTEVRPWPYHKPTARLCQVHAPPPSNSEYDGLETGSAHSPGLDRQIQARTAGSGPTTAGGSERAKQARFLQRRSGRRRRRRRPRRPRRQDGPPRRPGPVISLAGPISVRAAGWRTAHRPRKICAVLGTILVSG